MHRPAHAVRSLQQRCTSPVPPAFALLLHSLPTCLAALIGSWLLQRMLLLPPRAQHVMHRPAHAVRSLQQRCTSPVPPAFALLLHSLPACLAALIGSWLLQHMLPLPPRAQHAMHQPGRAVHSLQQHCTSPVPPACALLLHSLPACLAALI